MACGALVVLTPRPASFGRALLTARSSCLRHLEVDLARLAAHLARQAEDAAGRKRAKSDSGRGRAGGPPAQTAQPPDSRSTHVSTRSKKTFPWMFSDWRVAWSAKACTRWGNSMKHSVPCTHEPCGSREEGTTRGKLRSGLRGRVQWQNGRAMEGGRRAGRAQPHAPCPARPRAPSGSPPSCRTRTGRTRRCSSCARGA